MKLGRGRYSEVFKGVNLINNEVVVTKIIKPGTFYNIILIYS